MKCSLLPIVTSRAMYSAESEDRNFVQTQVDSSWCPLHFPARFSWFRSEISELCLAETLNELFGKDGERNRKVFGLRNDLRSRIHNREKLRRMKVKTDWVHSSRNIFSRSRTKWPPSCSSRRALSNYVIHSYSHSYWEQLWILEGPQKVLCFMWEEMLTSFKSTKNGRTTISGES